MATSDRPRGEANRGRCADRVLAPAPWCRWKQLLLMAKIRQLSELLHTRGTARSLALAAGAVTSGSAHTRHGEPAAPFAPRPHASEQRRHVLDRLLIPGAARSLPSHDNLKNPAAQRAVAHKVGTARSLTLAANAVTSGSAHPIRNGGDYAAKIRLKSCRGGTAAANRCATSLSTRQLPMQLPLISAAAAEALPHFDGVLRVSLSLPGELFKAAI
eukprot:scaffold22379_cov60-Phaeocystis_antarctica.AAC.4